MRSRQMHFARVLVGVLVVLGSAYSRGAAADAITLSVLREVSGTIEADGVPLGGFPISSSDNTLSDPTWGDAISATDVLVNAGSVPGSEPLQSWEQLASGNAELTSSVPAVAGAYEASSTTGASVRNEQENLTDAPFLLANSEWHSAFGVLFQLDSPHEFHLTIELNRSDPSSTNLFFLSTVDLATFTEFGTPGPVTIFSITDDDGIFDIDGVLEAGIYEAYSFTGSSATLDIPQEQVSMNFSRIDIEYKEQVIPEPASVLLLSLALGGMIARLRHNPVRHPTGK